MTYMRLPLFTWTTFVASALILFAFPPLTVGIALLMLDRLFGTSFFNPEFGGNTIIWEHLFWIFGHPEVYILVIPPHSAFFRKSFPVFARKRLFGYSSMVFATVLIGFLRLHGLGSPHVYNGTRACANAIFAVATMAIAVPTGIKISTGCSRRGAGMSSLQRRCCMRVSFIPTFVIGGVTGVMLAAAPADYQFHDTYFVVAHFHYVIIGGVVFGILAGAHYWWPKMFGKMLRKRWAKFRLYSFSSGST
jgi:cytochrome c oxidase subunit 1